MGQKRHQRPESAGRQCDKRRRPEWWEPETVLARLQSGEYVGALCHQASVDVDGVVSVRTFRADVSAWAHSARWGEEFTKALALLFKDHTGSLVLSKDWHDEFFFAMAQNGGDGKAAAESCGVGYGVVLSLMERRNKCYDAIFTERFRIAEAERVGRIRDSYFDYAENGADDRTRVGVQREVLAAQAPALHGVKQELAISGEVQHTHSGSVALNVAVVSASQARTATLLASRSTSGEQVVSAKQLPAAEPIVIDVTPQPQGSVTQSSQSRRA